jgi:hypothetical protein
VRERRRERGRQRLSHYSLPLLATTAGSTERESEREKGIERERE